MASTEKKRAKPRRSTDASGNKHAERTALTRSRLLKAAETVFARDGLEESKLEEIAAEAGYTRGAFYANFAAKEDLFIALLAEKVEKLIERVSLTAKAARQSPNVFEAMRENYVQSLKDRTWNVLFLEYKLFVLRHPEFKSKISAMQAKAFATTSVVLEEVHRGVGIELPVSTLAGATALAALANTLGIDLLVGKAIKEEEVETILRLFFDALTSHRNN